MVRYRPLGFDDDELKYELAFLPPRHLQLSSHIQTHFVTLGERI